MNTEVLFIKNAAKEHAEIRNILLGIKKLIKAAISFALTYFCKLAYQDNPKLSWFDCALAQSFFYANTLLNFCCLFKG